MNVDQTQLRRAILDPDAARPKGLTDGAGRPAGRRFDVYRNNVAVSLTEALESAFPVIRKLVGEANFKLLAASFLRQHPPSSPLMMFYGEAMPEFLADFAPTQNMGYMPDVARLELLIRESYHAADSTALDPALLQELAPEALMAARITLAPALRLLRSPWPVFSIWRYNMEEGAPKPQMEAQDVLITRPDLDPAPRRLPPGGGAFIATLLDGQPFGAAFEAATASCDTFDLGQMLALLIETQSMTKIGANP